MQNHGCDEPSEQYSQPFQFSVLFQSSHTILGVSFLQNTPLPSKNMPKNGLASLNAFIGFSWGPRLSAFTSHSISDSEPQAKLHREPVVMTPRPPPAIRHRSGLVPEVISQPFSTPIRRTSLPYTLGGVSLQRTVEVTGQRTKEKRLLSDREAMQQLVDCVGMSAHKKVLASGKKPRFLHTIGSQKKSGRSGPIPRPLMINTARDGYASEASSETESQPPSPTPRPSSAMSRNGWGGRSTPSLLAGRITPTSAFTTIATTFGTGRSDPSGTSSHLQQSSHGSRIRDQRFEDVERRYHRLLNEISILEEDVGNITLRLSRNS